MQLTDLIKTVVTYLLSDALSFHIYLKKSDRHLHQNQQVQTRHALSLTAKKLSC